VDSRASGGSCVKLRTVNEPEHTPDVSNQVTGGADGLVVQAGTIHGGVNFYGHTTPRPQQAGDTFGAVVDALLAVPSVRDETSRRLVLSRMRQEIAQAVPHHPRARLHVIELVRTCLDYDDGLGDLLRVLRELEGESIPVRRSAEAMRTLTEENP
jgi:Effector-associated domain 2